MNITPSRHWDRPHDNLQGRKHLVVIRVPVVREVVTQVPDYIFRHVRRDLELANFDKVTPVEVQAGHRYREGFSRVDREVLGGVVEFTGFEVDLAAGV
jgi:hypothetical protein